MAILFYFVIKAIFNVDRAEREAMARAEEVQDAQDARAAGAPVPNTESPEKNPLEKDRP